MFFIPSIEDVSHVPKELSLPTDIEIATHAMANTIRRINEK